LNSKKGSSCFFNIWLQGGPIRELASRIEPS
jgi:hypothetical protein